LPPIRKCAPAARPDWMGRRAPTARAQRPGLIDGPDCLALFGGHSASEPAVCAVPRLGGVNNCTDDLTLPKRLTNDETVVVAPGGTVDW
jgi:hypothetical protein